MGTNISFSHFNLLKISSISSNCFATFPFAGSVPDPSWLQPALVRSDCYGGWGPGAQPAQHQQNRLASGHDGHDPTPDDSERGQSSGWNLQAAAATQDCVRLNSSSFCQHTGRGWRHVWGNTTWWDSLGSHRSPPIILVSVQAIAKYVSRVLLKGHPISNQYFVDKSDFKEDWTINWSSHHPPWKIFYTSCVFISTTLTHTVAIFSVFVYECLYLLSRLLHGLTDCVPVIFYILKVLENMLEPYLHEFIFF